jgi:hypothetical protein
MKITTKAPEPTIKLFLVDVAGGVQLVADLPNGEQQALMFFLEHGDGALGAIALTLHKGFTFIRRDEGNHLLVEAEF